MPSTCQFSRECYNKIGYPVRTVTDQSNVDSIAIKRPTRARVSGSLVIFPVEAAKI